MRRLALLGASAVLVAVSALAPIAANAATYSASAAVVSQPTDWVTALSVDKFDSSKGTLVSATVKYSYGLDGFVKYENLNAKAQTISLALNGTTGLRWAGGADVDAPFAYTWTANVNAASRDTNLDWGGTAGGTAATFNSAFGPKTVTFTGTGLDAFQGTGALDFEAYSQFASSTISSGSVATWYETNTSGAVEVVYEYEPVPEPAGLLAIATGLIGMVGTVLKRRS